MTYKTSHGALGENRIHYSIVMVKQINVLLRYVNPCLIEIHNSVVMINQTSSLTISTPTGSNNAVAEMLLFFLILRRLKTEFEHKQNLLEFAFFRQTVCQHLLETFRWVLLKRRDLQNPLIFRRFKLPYFIYQLVDLIMRMKGYVKDFF